MTRAIGAAAMGVLLILSAAAFDSPSLYVPGAALAMLGAGAAGWVWLSAAGAEIVRVPGPRSVQEEDTYPLEISFRSGVLPPPGGQLVEPLLGQPLPVAGSRNRHVRVNVRFGRRGRRLLEPAQLEIRDPLGLAVRSLRTEASEVLVLPRIEPVLATGRGANAGTPGGAAQLAAVSAAELELDSLRPYRPGAPASRIHWPTVARTGTVMERRLVADTDSRPLVVLDTRSPASEEALDQAVRAAASLAVHLARGGGCALLLPGDRKASDIDPDLHAWPPLHARLALIAPDQGAPALRRRLERSGEIFWVTAARAGGLPAGLGRAAATARFLVAPEELPSRSSSFVVAGCGGRRLSARARRAA
jgi:uncharacterized protein (DUF58 family)